MLPLHIPPVYRQRQILRHDPFLIDPLHTARFQVLTEPLERVVLVEVGTEGKPTRPGEDGCDGVCGGFATFLVFAVVTRDGAWWGRVG